MALTNPGNTVRLHSRNAGHASVYESNMWAQKFTTGLYSGNGVLQNTPSANMGIKVGGSNANPDVLIASNPSGFRVALDLVSQQTLTLVAPASNSRIASIVAYTDDLSLNSTDTTTTGNQSSCGLIVVYGSTSASPTAPSDSTIRSAITTDGATGSQASYAVLTNITLVSTTTTITQAMIDAGKASAQMNGSSVTDGSVKSSKIDFTTLELGETSLNTDIAVASGSTSTQVPGLTKTVTIPQSVTRIEVMFNGIYSSTAAGSYCSSYLYNGAVGGTIIATNAYVPQAAGYRGITWMRARLTVTPGTSYTFNVGVSSAAGATVTLYGTSTPSTLTIRVIG